MSELFPNAPLTRAILEARFAGEMAIEIARAEIQHDVRSELPNLLVPMVVPEVAPALQPYVFRALDASEQLEVALNRVNYVTEKYLGYAHFKQRALHFFEIIRRRVPQIRVLNRVGLRYINNIPMLREAPSAPIRIRDYVNVGLSLPDSIPRSQLTEINSVFSVELASGTLKVVLRNELPKMAEEGERLILDFDFSQQQDLVIENLEKYVDLAHLHTKRVFMDLISQNYLPVMRAERS